MDITSDISKQTAGLSSVEIPEHSTRRRDGHDTARTAEQLRSTARQFETVLLHQVVKQMSETVNYTSLDEDDDTGRQMQGMYWSFMADELGRQGGMGYWKTIYEDLARMQDIDTKQFPADGNSQLNERL